MALCWRRNLIAILAFFGAVNIYILRANLSIAIVAMTKEHKVATADGNVTMAPEFKWDSREKGNILGAFFYGYVCTQFIGGWLAEKIGGARMYGLGILVTTIFNLILPLSAHLGAEYLMIVRVIEGLSEGVTFPSLHVVWSKWAPAKERTRLASFAFTGMFAGTVIAFPLCGYIAHQFGWPEIFYFTGIIALIWCLIWFVCVWDEPEKDPWISECELNYIKDSLEKTKKLVYPWKSIFTSMPFWAIVVGHCCETWGFYTMLTQLPSFVNGMSHVNIQSVGFLSAVPYLAMSFTLPVCGIISDRMRKNNFFTTTQVRKIINTFAFLGQIIFIPCAVWVESVYMIIACVTIGLAIGACAWSTVGVNHLDIAPQYAGVLLGLSNTLASMPGFISPVLTGYIVRDNENRAEWRIVFEIISAVYLFGAIFYLIFASGELQPWAQTNEFEESPTTKVYSETRKNDKTRV